MTTDNYFIADQFSLLSKLMDIHGENSFKSKTYSVAAFNIEKLPAPLNSLPREKIFTIKGIGESAGKKIVEILDTGHLAILETYLQKTPPGVLEMLNIKGLGPKKIATVWKEMGIESMGELLYACHENRLLLYKGFGEKTQKNVREAIEFYLKNQGSYLYAEAEPYALAINQKLKAAFPDQFVALTGAFRRQMEIISRIEWVTTADRSALKDFFTGNQFETTEEDETSILFKGPENVTLQLYDCTEEQAPQTWFETSSSPEFLDACRQLKNWAQVKTPASEEAVFDALQLPFIPACLREKPAVLDNLPPARLIQPDDIRAIIHCHSNWSDGIHSVEDMAKACIERGLEYMVLSDHSKSAFYAKGLTEDRIREQHLYVDELNEKLHPFRIFKSIECDILNDGSLDYTDDILATFDLVIASVHSNLKMTEEKAMTRLLRAIENPYTTILGHMTGRLLLSRPGYPVNHAQIIEACAAHNVVIELNAHPRRLDIDWRWIDLALRHHVLISVDPDAHAVEGFEDCRYGVLAAQKAGLTKEKNLSSFSLKEFEAFLAQRS